MSTTKSRFEFGISTAIMTALSIFVVVLVGCAEPQAADSGIINKTTQEIGEFDPDGDDKIADLQVKPSANPYASVGAYGYMVAEISRLAIEKRMQLYQAVHGRFPKDYEEFMTEIIKKDPQLKLPVLPGNRRYQYDVKNHELVVVEAEKKEK